MENGGEIRERLIKAGIRELQENGVQAFSLRRVAQNIGVSCAAPYNHFRDKQAFMQAVADAINADWFARQADALRRLQSDTAAQLRVICKEYLRFLCDNPHFCALITQRDESTGKWHLSRLFDQSSVTKRLILQYIRERGMDEQQAYCRIYAIRAILYGAAMMNQHDDMRLTEPVLETIGRIIDGQI